ncbi:PKD-like domain-containing protein, partial [Pedobacter sp. P351]
MQFIKQRFTYVFIVFVWIFGHSFSDALSQCTPNSIEFVAGGGGAASTYNTACANSSYQNINETFPTSGVTYQWEVSFNGGAYQLVTDASNVPLSSSDLSKTEITQRVIGIHSSPSGNYRIRRIVSDTSPTVCSNTSSAVYLYYAASTEDVSGGIITALSTTVCVGTSQTLTVEGYTGMVLQWESAPTSAGPFVAIPGATTNQYTYPAISSSTCYRVRVDNVCGGNSNIGILDPSDVYSNIFCVTAIPIPGITPSSQPTSASTCVNGNASFTIGSATAGWTYQWMEDNGSGSFTNISDGGIYNGATSPTLTITGAPFSMNSFNYKVVVSGACGPSVTSNVVVLTVNPTPTVDDPLDQIVCDNSGTTTVNFTGTATTYNWTNSNSAIGLAASGSGDIPSFTAINTGTSPIIATISVTPVANGCAGTAQTFTITINPTPTVNDPADQTACNNGATTAINFTGAIPTTSYFWTNNETSIGLGSMGLGNIPSFTAINSGTSPVIATITVTPIFNNCAGTPQTFTITVYPRPTVTDPADQLVCNNALTSTVAFSGATLNTTYNWTNNTPSIGLAASGSGNIPAFTAINTGTTPVTATITVTPVANGCPGTQQTFTIIVNPAPTVTDPADQVVCNNASTSTVTFAGTVAN